mgnify:FL=1
MFSRYNYIQQKTAVAFVFSLFFLHIPLALAETNYLWYENSSYSTGITFSHAQRGTFTEHVTNPQITVNNNNKKVAQFIRDGAKSPFIFFKLTKAITDLTRVEISLKAYTSIKTADLTATNSRFRLYLRNSAIGNSGNVYVSNSFAEGETWQTLTYNFNGKTIPTDVMQAGGYDELMIGPALGDDTALISSYYLDAIKSSNKQTFEITNISDWLPGSWGVRLTVSGGLKLDNSNADWVKGAQDIVERLPNVGHIITNFTHPAHGYYFTLRGNANVDIASEIHPEFVPSLENEKIILEVIKVFKRADKKVILYLATDGPSARGGTPDNAEYLAAWQNYYNAAPFDGDEAAAWRHLCAGFVTRFKGLVDGYWLDHFSALPGEPEDFVNMIKTIDPDVAIATNLNKSYVTDDNDAYIQVASDGDNDTDATEYKVISFKANDAYMDFTPGHPTPLAWGAPSNSWAYEEFTITEMAQNPLTTFTPTSKEVVSHAWLPMRKTWTGANETLVFNEEQAYRFVRRITDASAAITWGNTVVSGSISEDEMVILEEISEKMESDPVTDYVPYSRPAGAFLIGESTEPAPTDPAPTDPAPTDPAPTDPAPTEPAPTEPAPTEPAPTDPVPTDPAPTEPAPTDPAPTDPVPTESAPTDPAPEPIQEEDDNSASGGSFSIYCLLFMVLFLVKKLGRFTRNRIDIVN